MEPKITLLVLALLILSSTGLSSQSTNAKRSKTDRFIESSCQATRYPSVCVQSLSAYAAKIRRNDHSLVETALAVSLARAKSATGFVAKLTGTPAIKRGEYLAVRDCVETLGNGVDRLAQSTKELNRAGRTDGDQDFLWMMSNVQTWVSSALTDATACLDGFAGRVAEGKVKSQVRSRVVNVAQVTSNALALVNRLADRRSGKKP